MRGWKSSNLKLKNLTKAQIKLLKEMYDLSFRGQYIFYRRKKNVISKQRGDVLYTLSNQQDPWKDPWKVKGLFPKKIYGMSKKTARRYYLAGLKKDFKKLISRWRTLKGVQSCIIHSLALYPFECFMKGGVK